MDYSLWFVCLMGMGTVFFGLVCIIILTKLMSAVLGKKPAPGAVCKPQCRCTAADGDAGTGGRRIRRLSGGAGDRHYRHSHHFHEKSVI